MLRTQHRDPGVDAFHFRVIAELRDEPRRPLKPLTCAEREARSAARGSH